MQNWEIVLGYLRKQKDEASTLFYPVSLDEIVKSLYPNLSREDIKAALKELEYSGDVMSESIPGHPKTWEALT